MIKFELRISKNKAPDTDFNSSLIYSPQIEAKVREIFNPIFEINFMRGEKINLSNGDIQLRFHCDDEQEKIVAKIFQTWMFGNTKFNQSNN